MSEYIDERLIKARNAYKTQCYGDIYNGMFIREEKIEFEKQEMFDGKVSIFLPKEFIDMPDDWTKIKYPMSNRPQMIKTNDKSDVNLTFNLIPQKIERKEFENFVEQMKNVIKIIQDKNVFYEKVFINKEGIKDDKLAETQVEKSDRLEMAYFDYKSPAIDEPLYNFMCFALLDNVVFHGTFNCTYKESENWKPVFLQVIDSIRIGSR